MGSAFLEKYSEIQLTKVDGESHVLLVKYMINQLHLIDIPKNARHYSAEAVTAAFSWQLTSSSLYKKLQNLFILPSLSLLRKLSTENDVKSCALDLDILKARFANLTPLEKKVVLITLVNKFFGDLKLRVMFGVFGGAESKHELIFRLCGHI